MRQEADIYKVFELRTATLDYSGVGAINKMNDIAEVLKKDGITKVIVMPDCNKNIVHLADSAKNEDCSNK